MRLLLTQFICLLLLALCRASGEAPLVINSQRVRLGAPGEPEWEQFRSDPTTGRRLDVAFDSAAHSGEATLLIRQDDVKEDWIVQLNGRRLGKLFQMEADLVHAISVPAGVLRSGENRLSIFATNPEAKDDIVLNEIRLELRAIPAAVGAGTLAVSVTDPDAKPLPCRITIVDQRGTLVPLLSLQGTPLAVRPGVAYTGSGAAQLGLPAGTYEIYASRGFEYGIDRKRIVVSEGQELEVKLRLLREVNTDGWVSCDTHVHTFTNSRHGDATMDERMLTLAGEGIELPVAADHNFHADFTEPARKMGVASYFTPVGGNEVTTKAGHFNAFPITPGAPVPDAEITDWPRLMTALRSTPGVRVVVLHHPRNIHNGFQPFAPAHFNSVTGENKRGPEFTFDAMEVLISGAQQTDYMLVYQDWFALLNHGYRITALGSSDSHDVSRYIVGQSRTYIQLPDTNPGQLDVEGACKSLLEGRALVSMGLLTQLKVDDQYGVGDLATKLPEEFSVNVRVLGPSWVEANRVTLYANGVKIREEEIRPRATGDLPQDEKANFTWKIPRMKHDVHLVAIATGPDVTAPFWAMNKPYQPTSPRWEGRAIGSTNPIWIDADGDARFTSARGYAQRLVEQGTAPATILPALSDFDEAVAAQAASLCKAAGVDIKGAEFRDALKTAAPQVASGFARYIETLE